MEAALTETPLVDGRTEFVDSNDGWKHHQLCIRLSPDSGAIFPRPLETSIDQHESQVPNDTPGRVKLETI